MGDIREEEEEGHRMKEVAPREEGGPEVIYREGATGEEVQGAGEVTQGIKREGETQEKIEEAIRADILADGGIREIGNIILKEEAIQEIVGAAPKEEATQKINHKAILTKVIVEVKVQNPLKNTLLLTQNPNQLQN